MNQIAAQAFPVWEGVAILAPRGRDGQVARDLLIAAGIQAAVAASLPELADLLPGDFGCVLLTEESLASDDLETLLARVRDQPAWSDLPFVVLTNGTTRARSASASARLDALGNVVLLPRPLHSEELLRAVRSAITARSRQYEARARMDELHLREAQLRESEAKFHVIVNSIDQMIWSTMPDGFHDYYNDRWYEFTGVPYGSTDGEAWNGMFHEDDQERAWSVWRHSLQTGEPYHIEYRLRHHSGIYRWVLGRALPVRNEAGTIIRWYGSCTDIHQEVETREWLETAVRERTVELAELYDETPVALHAFDAERRLTSVSDRWLALLGYSDRDEVLGRPITEFVDEAAAADFETLLTEMIAENRKSADDIATRIRHRDGRELEVLMSLRVNTDGDGRLARVMASLVDIIDKKAAEAARDQAQAELRQSQKLETIGQLTGGVAHDFNNLLMAIRASIDLLARHFPEPDDKARRYLENALKATERGASLTQRMLAFARKQDLRADAVDVTALLPDLRDLLARSLGPQVEIVLDVESDVPCALVDANQLEMAILNLGVNGRDAMDGAGQLTVALRAEEVAGAEDLGPGRYVRIDVTDTGSGMDAAILAQAMEPFFTTKGVGKGTGLGLPMVHGLAKQSGGTFRMTSEPGKGTTASLLLPVAEASGEEPAAAITEPAAEHKPANAKARLTILAVDDDVLVLMGTAGLLEDMGHEVLEAHSGAEALAQIEARPDIDLMITDQAMPKMTGIELATKALEVLPELPIVLATGYAEMPEGAAETISARLEKPFSPAALERVVADLMGTP